MRRLTLIRLTLISTLLLLAACGGAPQSNDTLPTLAQLPTSAPPPATAAANPPEAQSTPIIIPTLLATPEPVRRSTSSPTSELPLELQGATATLPFNVELDVFPALAVGDNVTLQGRLDVKTDGATLIDSKGTSIVVLIDPFVADVANGQVVNITGQVIEQGGKQVVQMTAITVLPQVTPEAGEVPPIPTEGVPPLPTGGS
jgi:hypothetical protein